jgi:hypothetical protein
MRSLDTLTWPARRWLCDRLVGQHAYSRNVAQPRLIQVFGHRNFSSTARAGRMRIFDQESA